jgi:hypothetical protein
MLWKVVCTGERVVQVEAVATAAGEDAVDGLLRADALRTPELDVDVLERDPLDVRAMQPAQRAERRREGVRGVDAEPGQIGCDPRGAAGGVRDHGVESLEPERTRTGRDRVSAVPCGRRTGIAARVLGISRPVPIQAARRRPRRLSASDPGEAGSRCQAKSRFLRTYCGLNRLFRPEIRGIPREKSRGQTLKRNSTTSPSCMT